MNNIVYLYGLPIYIEKIDAEIYQKNKILSQIKENYKISNVRNNWSKGSHIKTDIHHSADDTENKTFNKIDYCDLSNKYEKIINNFFKKLKLKNGFNFKYNIVNYTCTKNNSFMTPHIHSDCSFALVHYISFDEKQHISTIFKSPYYFGNLLPNSEKLRNIFDGEFIENNWLNNEFVFNSKEDEVIIFPSILEHYVRNLDCEKLRITISVNIKIEGDYKIENK